MTLNFQTEANTLKQESLEADTEAEAENRGRGKAKILASGPMEMNGNL